MITKGDTGHVVTILIPPDRAKRLRFEKAPLLRPRHPFASFLLDLFRGGPNPFLASPIAVDIDRRTKIEQRARRAGSPPSPGMAEALGNSIEEALKQRLGDSVNRADHVLDQLDTYLEEEEDFLEASRPKALKDKLERELEKIQNDVNNELGTLATEEARRRSGLSHFQSDYQLRRTTWWGKPFTRQTIYIIGFIAIFEFILNSLFFAGSQRTGIIGGASLALLLSISTMVLGVGFGIAYQFSNSKAEGKGWFGRLAMVVLTLATVYYLLLLTLARLAGESGDTKMFTTAASLIQERPFAGLLDLPALAYFFFSVAVIGGIFYKYIDTMGHFPRLRSYFIYLNKAEQEFNETQRGIINAVRSVTDEFLAALEAAPSLIQQTTRAIHEIAVAYENVTDQFKNDVQDIKGASRLLASVVAQHLGVAAADLRIDVDFDAPLQEADSRLAAFRSRAAKLQAWEDVNSETVERCGREMTELGTRKLSEIEARCVDVRRERYDDLEGIAPPPRTVEAHDNVAWIAKGAA